MTNHGQERFFRAFVYVLMTLGTLACSGSTDVPETYTVELSPTSLTLLVPPGEPRSGVVTATVRRGNGEVVSPATVAWGTDSLLIASVSQTGTVTAVGEGTTVLRARFGGIEATAEITVTVPISFTTTGSMSVTRVFHTATLLPGGKVLIVGGQDRTDALGVPHATAEVYDPATGTFSRTGDMTSRRYGHSATLLPNGKVLIAGGIVGGGVLTATAELYDPATGTFTRTGDMPAAQWTHEGTLLKTGKVLISGGSEGWSGCCIVPATPQLYDPATGVFTTTGTYAGAYVGYETIGLVGTKATLLHDGRVLLTAQPAAQLYDPITATFSRTATMLTGGSVAIPTYINGQTATLLNDGRVLLTGGHHEDFGRFKRAELYDPATGQFTLTGAMARVRDGHTATLLSDGTVLIAGGESENGCDVVSLWNADIYDVTRGGFVPAGRMNVRREWHTATRLEDGRVLITGGLTFDGGLCRSMSVVHLSSAELYTRP